MQAQPLIAVHDVQASSRWYQAVLGLKSSHGGTDYEQLTFDDKMVLQLHRWDTHDHPHIGDPKTQPYGNGVLLWFQTNEFDAAVTRVIAFGAQILEQPKVNSNANHREVWLRDPNGYVVVLAGAYGDLSAS
jgi:catechol 2,3-dioxygenase-like lactoylglutathione lyase family enzyme